MTKQIKIDRLSAALHALKNGETEFTFFGITTNGTDCICFTFENGKINIEFEAVEKEQLVYFDKLIHFANKNNLSYHTTTHNNETSYKSPDPAPVLALETNATIDEVIILAAKIQLEIFNNKNETIYDLVP